MEKHKETYPSASTAARSPPRHLGGADEMYCEFDDDEHFLEYYEHGSDPWQLDNCAAKVPPAKLAGYHARLSKLRACAGVACRR